MVKIIRYHYMILTGSRFWLPHAWENVGYLAAGSAEAVTDFVNGSSRGLLAEHSPARGRHAVEPGDFFERPISLRGISL